MAQGDQTSTPVQQDQQNQDVQVQSNEPDYKKLYEETQGKVKEYEGKVSELSEVSSRMDEYFNKDGVAAERARLYLQALNEKKNPEDLWKAWETTKFGQHQATKDSPAFDREAMKQELLREIQPTLESVTQSQKVQAEQAASLALERDKAQIFKDEPWMTEDLYQEYEKRFGKQIAEMTGKILANQGPFLTQAQKAKATQNAENQALGMYAHLPEKQLLNLFMSDHRDKFIAEGRRPAPKMPEGMATDLPTGKAPQLLDQLKKAYKAVEGTSKVTALIKEFAPQLGLTEEKTYALVANE